MAVTAPARARDFPEPHGRAAARAPQTRRYPPTTPNPRSNTMASAPRERLLQLYKARHFRHPRTNIHPLTQPSVSQLGTQVFNTTFNPTNLRTGNKVLRQRLRGPALLDYYLKRGPTIKDMKKMWPEMRFVDEDEEQRVQAVEKYVWVLWRGGGGGADACGVGPRVEARERRRRSELSQISLRRSRWWGRCVGGVRYAESTIGAGCVGFWCGGVDAPAGYGWRAAMLFRRPHRDVPSPVTRLEPPNPSPPTPPNPPTHTRKYTYTKWPTATSSPGTSPHPPFARSSPHV